MFIFGQGTCSPSQLKKAGFCCLDEKCEHVCSPPYSPWFHGAQVGVLRVELNAAEACCCTGGGSSVPAPAVGNSAHVKGSWLLSSGGSQVQQKLTLQLKWVLT